MNIKHTLKSLIQKKLFFLILAVLLNFTGCLVVKEKDEIIRKEAIINYETAPKATLKMSDKIVRAVRGDMIASLPENWFFIEPSGGISTDVFAVAVNPDYTMSAVFSYIKKTNEITEVVNKEGLIGLARMNFNRHNTKSSVGINLVDSYKILDFANQRFGFYTFVNPKNNTFGSSAVFISSINEFYEFSLVTMNFTNNDLPTRNEFDKTFNSILATLKY